MTDTFQPKDFFFAGGGGGGGGRERYETTYPHQSFLDIALILMYIVLVQYYPASQQGIITDSRNLNAISTKLVTLLIGF